HHVFQPGQFPDDGGALRPRAAPGDVEVVAAGGGGVPTGATGGDPPLEAVAGALERLPSVEAAARAVLAVLLVVDRAGVAGCLGRPPGCGHGHDRSSRSSWAARHELPKSPRSRERW